MDTYADGTLVVCCASSSDLGVQDGWWGALTANVKFATKSLSEHFTWKGLLEAAGIGVTVYGAYYLVFRNRCIASYLLNRTKVNINDGIRAKFLYEFQFVPIKPREAHSHPLAAANRTAAERCIDDFIITMGYEPYSVSTSQRDVHAGERLYYHAPDVSLDFRWDRLESRHIIKMVDVDYYADMAYWLNKAKPVILYTFVPTTTGGKCVEGTFNIKDNVVQAVYNGGGRFEHQLWDYNTDHLVIKGWFYNTLVKVDQVLLPDDDQRRIICLTPITYYWRIFNWVLGAKAYPLRRTKITHGSVNILNNLNADGESYVSIGPNGSTAVANIRAEDFHSLKVRLGEAKHPNIGEVERYLTSQKYNKPAVAAPIIYDAIMQTMADYRYVERISCGKVRVTKPDFINYQVAGPLVHEDGKPTGIEVGPAVLLNAAFYPNTGYNADKLTVDKRILEVANKVEPSGMFRKFASEFISAIPVNVGSPYTIDEVIQIQDKPLQKIRCNNTKNWLYASKFSVKAFQKSESYQKFADPRNISTCTPDHTIRLSSFTYAFKNYIKKYDWFVPGNNPEQIATLVHSLVQDCDEVVSCDFSRLDGTISKFLRSVERGCYLRYFDVQYKNELDKLMQDEIRAKATTKHGVSYNTEFSRLSGSPLTTDGNTLLTAFVVYCAARRANLIGPGELEKIPSLNYGDDMLVIKLNAKQLEQTAAGMGLTLKCDIVERGNPVKYLARVFCDPWTSLTSVQDPKRALGKIHLSHVKNVDKDIVIVNKALGYLVTDTKTPLLSEYCNYILRKHPEITKEICKCYERQLSSDTNFWYLMFGEVSWPQDDSDYWIESIVAEQLEIDVSLLQKMRHALANATKDEDWEPYMYPMEVQPKHPVDNVLAGGQLIQPIKVQAVVHERGRARKRCSRNDSKSSDEILIDFAPTAEHQ